MHQRDRLAPPTSVQLEEGAGTGRAAATQVGENEFIAKRTFPDESVPLLPPEGTPTEIAGGVRRRPRSRSGRGLWFGLSVREEEPPKRFPLISCE